MFKTFKVDDLLFVEYKCVIDETRLGYWTHSNYFVYVVGGKKKWKTRDKEFLLKNGEALFIRKGAYTAHQFFDEDFCALGIFVTDEFIKNVLKKFLQQRNAPVNTTRKNEPIIQLNMDESLSAYFYSVLSYFSKTESPPKNLLTIKFEELIINILSSPQNKEIADYFWEVHSRSKVSISDVMETYFTYNMSLEEFARLCGRSLSTFKGEFNSIYKTSPGKWLIQKRLEFGKLLLETTDRSITEIAFDCGFKNQSHFTRCFTESYKKPPLKFRTTQTLTAQ